jgi:hypothetical protein
VKRVKANSFNSASSFIKTKGSKIAERDITQQVFVIPKLLFSSGTSLQKMSVNTDFEVAPKTLKKIIMRPKLLENTITLIQ